MEDARIVEIEEAYSIELNEVRKEYSDKMEKTEKDHAAKTSKGKNEIAELKGKYEDAKYEGGLWVRDKTLSLYPDTTDYFKWVGDDDEEMVNVVTV